MRKLEPHEINSLRHHDRLVATAARCIVVMCLKPGFEIGDTAIWGAEYWSHTYGVDREDLVEMIRFLLAVKNTEGSPEGVQATDL